MSEVARQAEIKRYEAAYKIPGYHMGDKRRKRAHEVLSVFPQGSTLLDVGAGRGELGDVCDALGIKYRGIEPVPYLANSRVRTGIATDIPMSDKAADIVACLDVLEHLIESDIEPALAEFKRVARKTIFLTASERPSRSPVDGRDLHISKRPEAEWVRLFRSAFPGAKIDPLGMVGVSPGWLITLQ